MSTSPLPTDGIPFATIEAQAATNERSRIQRIVQERLHQAFVKDGKDEVARALREVLERITNP